MSTDTAEQAQPTPEKTSIETAFRSLWLAVLGIPVAAAEGGGELFQHLVQKGEKVESQGKEHLKSVGQSAGRAVDTVSTTVGETIRDIGGKARSFAGKSEEAIDQKIADKLNPCKSIRDRIEKEIQPDPPNLINKGNVIANGVSKELDELRNILHSGKDYLIQLQQRESKNTGIPSLKIAYNNVFGY